MEPIDHEQRYAAMTVLTALVLLVLPAATPAQPVGKYFDSDRLKPLETP